MLELFHESLDPEPAQWESFLSKLDPPLAGEVRSLLAAHEEQSGVLDKPPAALRELAEEPREPSTRTASPADRLGPYRILEEISPPCRTSVTGRLAYEVG